MDLFITHKQIGLLLAVTGTVVLAFSLRTKRQIDDPEMGKAVDKAKKENPRLLEPTETYIVRSMFWIGLTLIAIGTLLQW